MIYRTNTPDPSLPVAARHSKPRFVRLQDYHYVADPGLGGYPVLSTPDRLDADPRYTGRDVTIAFIDSGFYPHPDLTEPVNRILAVYDAVNDRLEEDLELPSVDLNPPVAAWHGTMTSCAAAGNGRRSNGIYRGLASDANVVLVKTMTPHMRIRTPEVVRALQWVRKNIDRYAIRVVSMSIGVDESIGGAEHPVVKLVDELTRMGVVVVAAAGNRPDTPVKPPGLASGAITVGGVNDNNSDSPRRLEMWHSSFGVSPDGALKPELTAPAIFLAAPILPHTGVKAEAEALFCLALHHSRSLLREAKLLAPQTGVAPQLLACRTPAQVRRVALGQIMAEKLISTEYKHVDGTSFAAAVVSSVVAQLLQARPRLSPEEVRFALTATARALPGVPAEHQGAGVLHAARAVQLVLGEL